MDTIVAIASPPGEGGVGVIRISGPMAVVAAERHFRSVDSIKLSIQTPRLLQYGYWVNSRGTVMDEVLCVRFQGPHSFTGEDVVEVHAHGGAFHLREILKILLGEDVRLARAGEFTERAFINGKMDLTRAEAVADLINSGTELSRDAAARQLSGGLFELVESLRQQLIDLSAQVEAAVDFPDEEDQLLPKAGLLEKVGALRRQMRGLIEGAKEGRMLTQGISVALAGRPNVGKSSLMNALLGAERSIVTATAGTTRDYIVEKLSIQGFPVLLTDTAGLRESHDAIEVEGVRRSRERVAKADLLLLILDLSEEFSKEDFLILDGFKGDRIFVAHKADLKPLWELKDLGKFVADGQQHVVVVSSKTGHGVDALKAKILDVALKGRSAAMLDKIALTQARHEEAMRRAEECVGHVEVTLEGEKLSAEFLSGDLRAALDALGEIVGTTSREDVIHAIFSKFCIGK